VFKQLAKEIQSVKKEAYRKNQKTAIAITVTTQYFHDKLKIFPNRYFENFICLPVGLRSDKIATKLTKFADGKVDVIFVDVENKIKSCKNIFEKILRVVKKSKVYAIKGNDFSADSAYAMLCSILDSLTRKKICIIGAGNIGSKVALKLLESGAKVFIINSNRRSSVRVANAINTLKPIECSDNVIAITKKELPQDMDCVIGFTRGIPVITKEIVLRVRKGGLILDGGAGTISLDGIQEAKKKRLRILKLDIRMGFASYANLMLNTEKLVSRISGIRKINNFSIVAGGVIGNKGDVVLDSLNKPKKILGVADGKGKLLANQRLYRNNVNLVKEILKINK